MGRPIAQHQVLVHKHGNALLRFVRVESTEDLPRRNSELQFVWPYLADPVSGGGGRVLVQRKQVCRSEGCCLGLAGTCASQGFRGVQVRS